MFLKIIAAAARVPTQCTLSHQSNTIHIQSHQLMQPSRQSALLITESQAENGAQERNIFQIIKLTFTCSYITVLVHCLYSTQDEP